MKIRNMFLLSLMFGGIFVTNTYGNGKVVKYNAEEFEKYKNEGNNAQIEDQNVLLALWRTRKIKEDKDNILDYLEFFQEDPTKPLWFVFGSRYKGDTEILDYNKISGFGQNSSGGSTRANLQYRIYSQDLSQNLSDIIKLLLGKYGIEISDDDFGDINDKNSLISKLNEFYNRHPRQFVTIDPFIKITSKAKLKAMKLGTLLWQGYEKGRLGNLYIYNDADFNHIYGLTNMSQNGSGHITFVLVNDDLESLGNLSYRIYPGSNGNFDANSIEKFKSFIPEELEQAIPLEDIYRLAVLNNIEKDDVSGKRILQLEYDTGESSKTKKFNLGIKVYKPRYIDCLGAYNTTIGDELFKKVINDVTHSNPIYFYHQEIEVSKTTKDHIVGFYIKKNSFKGWREAVKKLDVFTKRTFGATRNSKLKPIIPLLGKFHGSNFSPFLKAYNVSYDDITKLEKNLNDELKEELQDGIRIKESDTKDMVFYIMRISDSMYKDMIINNEDYKKDKAHDAACKKAFIQSYVDNLENEHARKEFESAAKSLNKKFQSVIDSILKQQQDESATTKKGKSFKEKLGNAAPRITNVFRKNKKSNSSPVVNENIYDEDEE